MAAPLGGCQTSSAARFRVVASGDLAPSVDLRRLLPNDRPPAAGEPATRPISPPPTEASAWLVDAGLIGAESLAGNGVELESLAGDVGRRRYWRLRRPASLILVVYPPDDRPAALRFATTTRLLAGAGVRVPRILAQDSGRGLVAVEDLGDATVYDRRGEPWEVLAPHFEAAVSVTDRIATLPADTVGQLSPPLDEELLRGELRRTRESFLEPLGLLSDAAFSRRLEDALDRLCRQLGAGTPSPCHRDFMVRNLVPCSDAVDEPTVGVLDHQDLRLGPPWYDLASLANDSLFPPPADEERWVAARCAPESYHAVAAQRTLKAVGTYAAFAGRGVDRHLALIPPTLERALEHLRRVPATAELAEEARDRWAGVIALLD